jgi:hypothetical protein
MTINIQKASNVTVIGSNSHKNCKAVYCITTGEMYPSILDAASENDMSYGAMCQAIMRGSKCRNGKKFCLVRDVVAHLDEISEHSRLRANKVAAYDADMARRAAISKAQEKVTKRKANADELRRKLADADALVAEAERELHELTNN